jgi:transposase
MKNMPYNLDLRKRVVDYVEKGGSATHAATIYRWLGRENLAPTIIKHRNRKID